ncbi:MAG: hypothetical protein ABIK68_11100 [bacterium]
MDGLVRFLKNHPFGGAAVGSIILINQGALMIMNNGLNQCSDPVIQLNNQLVTLISGCMPWGCRNGESFSKNILNIYNL